MFTASLATAFDRASQRQQPLPGGLAVLLGIVTLAVTFLPEIWALVRYTATLPHEGAHAIAAAVFGARIHEVKVSRNWSGETSISPVGRTADLIVTFVGYLGPSAFGLGAALLIAQSHAVAALWLALLLLVIVLFKLHSAFTFLVVAAAGGALFLVARYAPVGVEVVVAYVLTWFLLLSGLRVMQIRGAGSADAYELRRMTHLPEVVWAGLWHLGTYLGLASGAYLLVGAG